MKAINIKCEYLKNPIGIDIERPRIMWNCEGCIKQTAYQVVADGWDSGKVESSSMRCHLPIKLEAGKRELHTKSNYGMKTGTRAN